MTVRRDCLYERFVELDSEAVKIPDVARMRSDGKYLKLCFLSQYISGATPPTVKFFRQESFLGDNIDVLAASWMNMPEFGLILRGDFDVKSVIIDNSGAGCGRFVLQIWRVYDE